MPRKHSLGLLAGLATVTLIAALGCDSSGPATGGPIGTDPTTGGGGGVGSGVDLPTINALLPDETCATAGNTVVITGENLSPDGAFPSVTIDGRAATVVDVLRGATFDQVTVVTPNLGPLSAPVQVNVTVTTSAGTARRDNALLLFPSCDAAPIIAQGGVSPSTGNGGEIMTLTGDNLACATSVVFVGPQGNFQAEILGAESDRSLVVEIPTNPFPTDDAYDIVVTSACGTFTRPDAFIFSGAGDTADIPDATGINPQQGPAEGSASQSILITGVNLDLVDTIRFGSRTLVVDTDFFLTADGSLLLPSIPPSGAGPSTTITVPVTVLDGSEADPTPVFFTYIGADAPTCTGFTPASGATTGGTPVIINGTGLNEVTSVEFGGTPGAGLTHPNDSTIGVNTPAFEFPIPVNVELLVDATVVATCPIAFEYEADSTVPPFSVSAISPDAGPELGGQSVTIDGTGLSQATSVTICGVAATIQNLGQSDEFLRIITGTFMGPVPEICDVVVSGPGGSDTLVDAYEYLPSPPDGQTFLGPGFDPRVAEGQPAQTAPAAGGVTFRFTGDNLIGTEDVIFGGTEATQAFACSVFAETGTSVTGIAPPFAGGGGAFPVDVEVFPRNAAGTDTTTVIAPSTPNNLFRYYANPGLSAAFRTSDSATGVSPGDGITLLGGNFRPEADVFVATVFLRSEAGAEFPAAFSVLDNNTIQFTVPTITGDDLGQFYDIVISTPANNCTDGAQVSLGNALFVGGSTTAGSVSPNRGPYTGGTRVTITGNFDQSEVTSVLLGGVQQAIDTAASTDTMIVITTSAIPEADADGTLLDVTVNTQTGSSTIPNAFQYVPDPDPATVAVATENCGTVTWPASSTLPLRQGLTVTVTGTDLFGVTQVLVGDTIVAPSDVSETSVTFSAPADPGTGEPLDLKLQVFAPVDADEPAFQDTLGGIIEYQPLPTIESIAPATGTQGDLVTITGTNFVNVTGDSTSVTFDGVAANVLSVTDTTIQVEVPGGPAGANVVVEVETCTGQAAGVFTYDCDAPSIDRLENPSDVTITSGAAGDVVTIVGTDLTGPNGEAPTVTFGDNAATVLASSPTEVDVSVPAGEVGAAVQVSLTTCGGTATTSFTYTCPDPAITSVTPDSGMTGTQVTISGINLSPDGQTPSVLFGSQPASVSSTSDTTLTVVAPAPLATGVSVDITVSTCGSADAVATNAFFYCPAPTITSFTPTTGTGGQTEVTISGSNLSPDGEAPSVLFGATEATTINAFNDNSVTVVAPVGPTGAVRITVQTCGGTVQSTTTFLYCSAPTVNSFSPAQGEAGTIVEILGSNLIGADGANPTVYFNDPANTGTIESATDTRVRVTVPALTTGEYVIFVETCGGVTDAPGVFTFCADPEVTALMPNNGTEGSAIQVMGTNLLNSDGSPPNVRFGTRVATVLDATTDGTMLLVEAPGGIPAGSTVNVTVTTDCGTSATSADSQFMYTSSADCTTPQITGIDPTSGQAGTVVTITGTDLTDDGATPTVTFGAEGATVASQSPTQLVVTAPTQGMGFSGPVDVTVTTCASTTAPNGFTYEEPIFDAVSISPNSGSRLGGQTITITGVGLSGVNDIEICGVDATNITIISDTRVSALTGEFTAPGPVTCDVFVSDGTNSDTLADAYTYLPLVPNAQDFGTDSAETAPAAGGTAFRLSGVRLLDVDEVQFGGDTNDPTACEVQAEDDTSVTGTAPAFRTAGGPFPATVEIFASSAAGRDDTPVMGFTYYANPTLTGASGSCGAGCFRSGDTVMLSGTNFMPESWAHVEHVQVADCEDGGFVDIVNFTIVDNTTIEFDVGTVPPNTCWDIRIKTPNTEALCTNDYSFTLFAALRNAEFDCVDMIDNDQDGDTDCADPDCAGSLGPSGEVCQAEETNCADGFDNDGDGFTDCADANCDGRASGGGFACEAAESSCGDGNDNDGDGDTDCEDGDCAGATGPMGQTCEPGGETTCDDGLDNDADGFADCADFDCNGDPCAMGMTCVAGACT